MDFFNRLGMLAKSVSDKTGDMLEISKLNAQVRSKEDDIEELKLHLGEYMWAKFDSGVLLDEQATSICRTIREAYAEIASAQAEIESIRQQQEAAREQAAVEAEAKAQMRAQSAELRNEVITMAESAGKPVTACPACGCPITDGSRFCGSCGTKLY